MLEKIQKIFNELTGREDVVITSKTKLNSKEYSFSSFAIVQMVCALEDEFDVEIPNSQIKKFKTVGDIEKFLKKNAKDE